MFGSIENRKDFFYDKLWHININIQKKHDFAV